MKVLVIGATGTIGAAIAKALEVQHEVLRASHSRSALTVDLSDPASIARLYEKAGPVDAVVNAAGNVPFGPLLALSDADFALGLSGKLMGQINLVRLGAAHVSDGGSFTLTSGILSRRPAPGASVFGAVNAGIEGFVRSAALDLPRGIRINAVSPGWVAETLASMNRDPSAGTPAAKVASFYVTSVDGTMTGQTLDVETVK